MSKQRKEEKQQIKLIVDKIDNIIFGNSRKPITTHKIDSEIMMGYSMVGLVGGCGGSVCNLFASSLFIDDNEATFLTSLTCLPAGMIVGIIVYLIDNKKLNYNDYEVGYLGLPRDKQLEVLNLAKKLVHYYKRNIQTKRSERYVKNYLNIVGQSTMFDQFDREHPQFDLLEQSKIDDIHSRGKITPYEQYLAWEKNSYCPNLDCSKLEDCRDCLVKCAKRFPEWDPELDDTATTQSIKKKVMNS